MLASSRQTPPTMTDCLPEDELLRFHAGQLHEDACRKRIAEHLADCAGCTELSQRISAVGSQPDTLAKLVATDASESAGADSRVQTETSLDRQPTLKTQSLDDFWPPPPPLANHPRWRIRQVLGVGGTGAVYLAEDQQTPGAMRALKMLQPNLLGRHQFAARFRREVALMRAIPPHENLILGFETESLDSFQLLVMEYVPGVNLEELASSEPKNRLAYQRAVGFILQALAGLEHAWRTSGLVHRDIKPGNLMLTRDGKIKLLDFGLAKLEEGSEGSELTQTGIMGGTPKYCSPEQDRGLRHADIRSDLYSIGCTLFRLIAGEPVFGPETGHVSDIEIRLAHHMLAPRPLRALVPDVPAGLDLVLRRLLAKDPQARPATHLEVAQLLLPFATIEDQAQVCRIFPALQMPDATKAAKGLRAVRLTSRRGLLLAGGMACLLAVCVLSILGLIQLPQRNLGQVEIAVESTKAPIAIRPPSPPSSESIANSQPTVNRDSANRPLDSQRSEKQSASNDSATHLPMQHAPHQGQPTQMPTAPLVATINRLAVNRLATILRGSGRWEREGDELCHYDGASQGEQWLLFGDVMWRDYDFQFEVLQEGFPTGVTALYRSPDDEHIQHFGFGWLNLQTSLVEYREGSEFFRPLVGPSGEYRKRQEEPIQADRWYTVRVHVRGDKSECVLDGKTIFSVTNNRYATGRVGVRTWRQWSGKTRFRHLRVVSADGVLLWEGPPDLPGPNPRRFVVEPPVTR